jgi:hypothetical protein
MRRVEVRGGHRTSAPSRVGRTRSQEHGAVTAEAAAVLPVLVAVVLGLVWCLSLVVAQVRVVDSAREVARAGARGDDEAAAVAAGRRVAPDGATVSLSRDGDRVVAEVRLRVRGPGGLFRHLPGPTVRSRAVAVAEPT